MVTLSNRVRKYGDIVKAMEKIERNKHINILKQSVDNVVIVLTGQPRATSLPQWKSIVSDYYRPVVETYNEDTGEWTKNPGPVPNVDVILVLNEKDTPDKYFDGVDPHLAGLGSNYLIPVDYSLAKYEYNRILFQERFDFKVNKEKWEKYQSECWSWADSINFVYCDIKDIITRVEDVSAIDDYIPSYETQFWHFNIAYSQHTDIFDKLTKNSVVVRQRYDLAPAKELPVWKKIARMFNQFWSEKSENNPTGSYHLHNSGVVKSPLVLLSGQLHVIRGKLFSSDFHNMFDGPGAVLFGKHFMNWCIDPVTGMFTDKHGVPFKTRNNGLIQGEDWSDPEYDPSDWVLPETLIPKFCQKYQYTIIEIKNIMLDGLFSRQHNMVDTWRLHWYDDWTPELVQEIQQYFLKENKVT